MHGESGKLTFALVLHGLGFYSRKEGKQSKGQSCVEKKKDCFQRSTILDGGGRYFHFILLDFFMSPTGGFFV